MNGWIKANAMQVMTLALVGAMAVGQWQYRQDRSEVDLERLATRVMDLENYTRQERQRLDAIYLLRDTATAQNSEILRRLDSIERLMIKQ